MASFCCHPSSPTSYWSLSRSKLLNPKHHTSHFTCSRPRKPSTISASLKMGVDEIATLVQNKVLVATAVASAIGQLAKPFSSVARGEGIDLKAAFRSGGMPSAHSAAVMAASMTLGLERGLSDPVFGTSAVFAAIVMYDSQGVRREVGKHANRLNILNRIQEMPPLYLNNTSLDGSRLGSPVNAENLKAFIPKPEDSKSVTDNEEPLAFSSSVQSLTRLDSVASINTGGDRQQDSVVDVFRGTEQLSESVGHTEIQVIAGALLGLIVSLVIETIL